jgi:hypothetical protein
LGNLLAAFLFCVHPAMTQTVSTQITQTTADYNLAVQEIGAAWKNCERPNLEFGKACCKWRDLFGQKHSGPQTKGTGLAQILSQLNINEGTAYYWIYRYEVSIGTREAKEKKPVAIPVVGTLATAPVSSSPVTNTWTRDKEKRKSRSEPLESGAALRTLANKLIDAGYKTLLETGEDPSHLWSVKEYLKGKL